MAKTWKKNEITYLKRYADKRGLDELARRFGTDQESVRAKLQELGLAKKESGGAGGPEDSLVPTYEKALRALHDEKWEKAAEVFAEVAKGADQLELAAKARGYLRLCERHLADDDGGFDEPFDEAVFELNRGNLERVLELCGEADEDERWVYLRAAVRSREGELADAAEALGRAIEMNSTNRVRAYHDPDFEALRESDEHAGLFAV